MKKVFKSSGTFTALNEAKVWLRENGYSCGSLCRQEPIAIQIGEYTLPQKYKNMNKTEKLLADGWIKSNDFREGDVEVNIINH